ncbi:LysR family transcriptional regulator [Kribbella sp. NPDC023855]|uniref:LysR family transcriptional regulator n=1 Tax=Kribbella sp. NPDC023855 TaxID=3154698 RepID=UPI0033FBA096
MDPHLLRTFLAVTDLGSFSAAADQLGYTQSAVSQHIAALEHDLGTPLLHRRPVTPTPAGERLLEHAAPILLRLDAARADVLRTVGDPPGTLILGTTPLATSPAAALTELRRSRPTLDITITVTGREAVAHGVAAGEFHLGLIDGVAAPSDPLRLFGLGTLRTTAVAHEPLVVTLPNGHPLARRSRVSLHDLVDARWIDSPDLGAPLADLRAATESDALRPALSYHGTDTLTLLKLVAAGHGLALLPASITAAATSAGLAISTVLVDTPRLVHRTELLHGHIEEPTATTLAAALSTS